MRTDVKNGITVIRSQEGKWLLKNGEKLMGSDWVGVGSCEISIYSCVTVGRVNVIFLCFKGPRQQNFEYFCYNDMGNA